MTANTIFIAAPSLTGRTNSTNNNQSRPWALSLLSLLLLVSSTPYTAAFSFLNTKPSSKPSATVVDPKVDLSKLAVRLHNTQFNYKITFGTKDQPFPIQNVQVQLGDTPRTPKQLSTGIHDAQLLTTPSYINEKGLQSLELTKGGWELSWNVRQKSPHGFLTCSFISPETVVRNPGKTTGQDDNDNVSPEIPAGRFLIMHRVWTRSTLQAERIRRKEIQSAAAQQLQVRDEKVQALTSDQVNAVSKVKAYAQAAQSMNEYYQSGYQEALYIPLYDEQVLEVVPEECIVSTRGQIYASTPKGLQYLGESRVDLMEPTAKDEDVE